MHNQHTSTIKAPLTSQNHHNPSSVPNESASTPDRVNPQGSPKLLFTNTLSERIRFVSNCQSSACYLTAQHNPTTLSFFPPAASLLVSTLSHNPVRSHIQFKHSLISQRHRKKSRRSAACVRVRVSVCAGYVSSNNASFPVTKKKTICTISVRLTVGRLHLKTTILAI